MKFSKLTKFDLNKGGEGGGLQKGGGYLQWLPLYIYIYMIVYNIYIYTYMCEVYTIYHIILKLLKEKKKKKIKFVKQNLT